MVESTRPRPGVSAANPINGREYATHQGSGTDDDLQYACIFPLPEQRDCTDPNRSDDCDCADVEHDKPLCEVSPGVDPPGTTQYWAKAYPGLRHEIFNEPERERVFADLLDWLRATLPKSGPPPAGGGGPS